MAYFLPSFFQKRLLRYALSRLELVDTDALDLDSLGIRWGQRSTFELRDVGLKLVKLSSVLRLPPTCELLKARLHLIRVTIPADIYNSGILIEAEGINVHLRLLSVDTPSGPETGQKPGRPSKSSRPEELLSPSIHDLGGDHILPTPSDLAQSFLESEPQEDKEELQAAISSQSQYLQHSPTSFSDDEDEMGLGGEGVSLPSFIADFLKGVVDRLQMRIKDVTIRVDMDLPQDGPVKRLPEEKPDPVTALLTVQELSVTGIARAGGVDDPSMTLGRRISLSTIQAMLVSDPVVFSNYSRFAFPPSPSTAHSKSSEIPSRASSPSPPPPASSDSGSAPDMTRSTIFDPPELSEGPASPPCQPIEESTYSSDGRFSDAGTEAEYGSDSYSSDHGISESRYDDRFLDNPGYLDDVLHSQLAEDIEDSILLSRNLPATSSGPEFSESIRISRPSEELEVPMGIATDTPAASHTVHEIDGGLEVEGELEMQSVDKSSSQSRNSSGEYDSHMDSPTLRGESVPDDLSESKLFSHDEAESLYMSAISQTSRHCDAEMPGAWGSSRGSQDKSSPEPILFSPPVINTTEPDVHESILSTPKLRSQKGVDISAEDPQDLLEASIPVKTQSELEEERSNSFSLSLHTLPEVARRLFDIDTISIWLPSEDKASEDETTAVDAAPVSYSGPLSGDMKASTASLSESVADDENINFPNQPHEHVAGVAQPGGPLPQIQNPDSILVEVGRASIQLDIASGWLLAKAGQKVMAAYGSHLDARGASGISQSGSRRATAFRLTLDSCSIKLLEHLAGFTYQNEGMRPLSLTPSFPAVEDVVLRATISDVKIHLLTDNDIMKFHLDLSKFLFGCASEDFLSFNEGLKMRESTRDILAPVHGDLSLSMSKSRDLTKINLSTLPLHVNINIQRLEETLAWFGGLSTILELGSSIASVSTVRGGRPEPTKRTRGVHFETDPPSSPDTTIAATAPWKVNCRIGGIVADVVGESHALKLKTTAMKVVSRPEGIGVQIDKAKLSGPFPLDQSVDAPAKINIGNIRVEYVGSPKEVDLDRLLSLITPSKDKYDDDDDIMLDTLFRQRKQGAVLRITLGTTKIIISRIDDLDSIFHLLNEFGKLSNVTKYLPEDDRPGILTLALVRELEGQVHFGGKIGDLGLRLTGTEAAHVSIPSLIASQVGTIALVRNDVEELLGEAVEYSTNQSSTQPPLPVIMARFIADELDPSIKFKLHNLRIEYTVSSIVAFLGLVDDTTAEDLVANMADSVVNITDQYVGQPKKGSSQTQSSGAAKSSKVESKPSRITVSLRGCVLGLNPRDIPAKGLVVLTNAKFAAAIHGEDRSDATFDIRKATIMITDDTQHAGATNNLRRRSQGTAQNEQLQSFVDLGYVPVCFISSAMIVVNVGHPDNNGKKSLDVEVRDDLLILETCADSMQTLINILNGLQPPMPPSTALKYRTEIMPIQDMLASFSGDAFATDDLLDSEGLSDAVEAEFVEKPTTTIDDELEYVSDFYPSKPEYDADSLSGSTSSSTLAFSQQKPLLGSFHSDHHVSSSASELEFRDDHFSKKSAVGGTAHRWDSAHNTYGLANDVKLKGSPLRVRVRDVHFIWNLFDGYDWQRTRDTISKAVKNVETKAIDRRAKTGNRVDQDYEDEESVIGDFLFNSIYIGIPANKDPRDLSHEINHDIDDVTSETGSYATSTTYTGITSRQSPSRSVRGKKLRLSRSKHQKMTFELRGISADLVVFPPGSGETQSSLDIRVNDVEIFDHIPSSTWKKFATYMYDAGERESGTSMVHLELLNVKPVADLAASEMVLKATILPLRLHVDQDALDFMSRFFEFKDDSVPSSSPPGEVPFLQRVEVNAVRVRLDFKPKRVDYSGLRSGRTTEFMNFFVLDEADMVLRHVIVYGVSGFDKLGQTLNDIWMPDIKRNQLPDVLAGLAPIRSLVNVGSGVKDLVVIPMREYKKDGRVVRSIQKGALAFAKTTTSELVKLGAKLAIGTQTVLQGAEDFLTTPGEPRSSNNNDGRLEDDWADEDEKKKISLYADQPVGVVQGLRGGFRSLERDLLMARNAIVAVPGEVLESGSAAAAAKAVWKRAPTVILRPAIGASRAVGQTLLGAGNTLDPQNIRRMEEKYKKH
ncbi:hypothetical protein V8E54_002771 [Elaphomyces granulatus]